MTLDGSTLPVIVADEDLFLFFRSGVAMLMQIWSTHDQALECADRRRSTPTSFRQRPIRLVTQTDQTVWTQRTREDLEPQAREEPHRSLNIYGCLEVGRPPKMPFNPVETSKEQHEIGKDRVWRKIEI